MERGFIQVSMLEHETGPDTFEVILNQLFPYVLTTSYMVKNIF